MIGFWPDPPTVCDAGPDAGVYQLGVDEQGVPVLGCRCLVCGRCGKHTGNSNQGHYWRWCKRLRAMASDFHFCCPDDCELVAPAEEVAGG